MSYEISLYLPAFLERALEEGLGDWTGADRIPEPAAEAAVAAALSAGFVAAPVDPAFVALVRAQGREPAREFLLETETILAELHIHPGQIAFGIPYGPAAEASIALCAALAADLAARHGLAVWDPQEGGEEDDTSSWLEALGADDVELRTAAASALGGREADAVARALGQAARRDEAEVVRRTALESLGELGESAADALDDVLHCLDDPNPIVQYWATFALGRLGPGAERALPALERLCASAEPGPRHGAIDAVRRIRERIAAG